eukprot:CAMPEP_0119536532 /NCGR_PEP_ID=MMETSP1344-20130328/49351_1 /TAXON_ID=236787 /ORGANISM="Florenciella parvula, Strain CCMP2471" /LENGTH=53 /DNA_ID=CAMNT_0007578619 /DNA_START=80 /DNA_END=241 /DNA_ORIENTATION=+
MTTCPTVDIRHLLSHYSHLTSSAAATRAAVLRCAAMYISPMMGAMSKNSSIAV